MQFNRGLRDIPQYQIVCFFVVANFQWSFTKSSFCVEISISAWSSPDQTAVKPENKESVSWAQNSFSVWERKVHFGLLLMFGLVIVCNKFTSLHLLQIFLLLLRAKLHLLHLKTYIISMYIASSLLKYCVNCWERAEQVFALRSVQTLQSVCCKIALERRNPCLNGHCPNSFETPLFGWAKIQTCFYNIGHFETPRFPGI